MATLADDRPDYPDLRSTAPPRSPGERRLTEALTYVATTPDTSPYPLTLEKDALTYWQAHDRRAGRTPRSYATARAVAIATYLLGCQDEAMLLAVAAPRDTADDRPSGVLALVGGMFYTAVLFGLLFGAGLVLGAIRFGG
jgi:hypothetical protein